MNLARNLAEQALRMAEGDQPAALAILAEALAAEKDARKIEKTKLLAKLKARPRRPNWNKRHARELEALSHM